MASAAYKIKEDLSNLKVVLMNYDAKLKNAKEDLRLDRKSYMQANGEQAALIAYYDYIGDELDIMVADMELRYKVARGKAMKLITGSSPKEYTEKNMGMLLDTDPTTIKCLKAMFELKERREKARTIVNSFVQRGYA